MKHFKIGILIWMLLTSVCAVGVAPYRTKTYTDLAQTLQVYLNGEQTYYPVMRLNTTDAVDVAFDLMTLDYMHLAYKIELCRADWTPSAMDPLEYLEGINEVVVEDATPSMNTKFDYTHYSFQIPNEQVKPTLPGNYVVKVYDTDHPEKILLTGCFSILEDRTSLNGNVSGKSVYGVNNRYQHLSFELFYADGFNPMAEELTVVVRQNGRHDNEVFALAPTYVKPTSMVFDDERRLSFEGGKEYNKLDFSHRFRYSGQIDRISYHEPYYHVDVFPGKSEDGKGYAYDKDVNGHFKVHAQDVWSEEETDYSIVHFTYPKDEPWLDGALYVMGGFNDNWLDTRNKMVYNFDRKQYELSLLLKNGGYNFLYAFLPSGENTATIERAEGSHWETENAYQIYIYYRPIGSNYDNDQLVGYFEIDSQ